MKRSNEMGRSMEIEKRGEMGNGKGNGNQNGDGEGRRWKIGRVMEMGER